MNLKGLLDDPEKAAAFRNFGGLLGDMGAGFTAAAQNGGGIWDGFALAGQAINKGQQEREDRELIKLLKAAQIAKLGQPKEKVVGNQLLRQNDKGGYEVVHTSPGTNQWESVDDPMFGKGLRNTITGDFKSVKSDVQDPAKAMQAKQAALDVTDRLLNNISGVKANRGGISSMFPNISNSSVDAEADLETLSSLLTTENLGLLKGVLSDTDMRILKDIGAGGLKGSDAQVIGNLKNIRAKLAGQVGQPSGMPAQSGVKFLGFE